MTTAHGSDKSAAFAGLIVGILVLFLLVFGISRITTAQYAHEATTTESPH